MTPEGAPPAGETTLEPLTLESLLAEPLLRAGAVLGDEAAARGRHVEWCLPVSEALSEGSRLDGVVVVARSDLLAQERDVLADQLGRLRGGGAIAVVVLGGAEGTADLDGLAVRHGLPLVLVPSGASFREVSHLVAEKRLARSAHAMAYGVSVHRELADVLYHGSGLTAMARRISRLTSSPAFLLDTQLEVLAYESLGAGPVPDPDELIRNLRERLRSDASTIGHARGGPASLAVELEHQTVSVVVEPIVLGGTTYGWVVIVEQEHPPHPHDLAQHLVVAEQAVMITGSEMLRLRSIEEAEERAKGDFVHALLHGRFANAHELAARAAHHDFDVDGVYAVAVARGALDASTTQGLARQLSLVRAVQQVQPSRDAATMATPLGDLLVVVRTIGTGHGRGRGGKAEHDAAATFAEALRAFLEQSGRGPVAVAFGRPGGGVEGVMTSYREARVALEVARRLGHRGVAGYGDLRVFAVLAHVAQDVEGTAFAREVFEPLHAPGERADDLEPVLMAYIESGGNLNAAARALYMHRNTVLYKLEKASRLLGMDIRSAENQFTIWLAHRLRVLAEVEADVGREVGPPS